MNVAALFVRSDSVYRSLGVDCWDADRDALKWQGGGCPAVAHPPCRAWGMLAGMAKSRQGEKELAVWAIDQVRRWGGVLEHPFASKVWDAVGCGSFGVRDRLGGVLVPVFQSWWGHRALKKTGLYVVGPVPELPFDDLAALRTVESMGKCEREETPLPMARWLVQLAAQCEGWGRVAA